MNDASDPQFAAVVLSKAMNPPGVTLASQLSKETIASVTAWLAKLGVIAGSYVRSGTIRRNSRARLVRDGVVVYDGKIASLRRFKDDVAEVRDGYECGIGLENYQDLKDGDIVEAYEVEDVARSI